MKIVTLLRKPFPKGSTVASNSLSYGTGGVNIDESRIKGAPWKWGTQTDIRGGGYGSKRPSEGDVYATNIESNPKGRWPANLVLQHLPVCCQTGIKTVKGNGHYPSSRPKGSNIAGATGHSGQESLTEMHLTTENVASWVCVAGCPVEILDSQSGTTQSSARVCTDTQSRKDSSQWRFKPTRGTVRDFGDSGGASRFFKQVQTMVTHDKEIQS